MTAIIGEAVTVSWAPVIGTGVATLAVTQPDGAALIPAPMVSGTIGFTASFTPTMAGRYALLWTRGNAKLADVLDVWPATPRLLISVDDAADAVGSGAVLTQAKRDELSLYIAAATTAIEDICGPVVRSSRTATFTIDTGTTVVLPALNVTVSSVTVDGVALSANDYEVDSAAGIITGTFASDPVITWIDGAATIDPAIRLACREQVRFLWQTTRNGASRDAQVTYTPSGYTVPRSVEGLCRAAQTKAPGFA